jgi:Phage Connector (GP10).
MSRKRDLVWDNYYAPHATGFRANPTNDYKSLRERMYVRVLTELCVNRYKWSGLPNSIDERFLENTLFRNALSVFFFSKKFDRHLALRGVGIGAPNMYDNPTQFRVVGNQQINATLLGNECVPIWGNSQRMPDLDIVRLYADSLAELDMTFKINSKNLRKTRVIVADENQRLSWQNLDRQFEEGVEVIYGTSALDVTQVQALDFNTDPQGVLNLQIVKSKMWNECMTLLGINNANQDKKERLVSDEVSANDEQVESTRNIGLKARKLACIQINKMFKYKDGTPLQVSVDFAVQDQVPTTNFAEGL